MTAVVANDVKRPRWIAVRGARYFVYMLICAAGERGISRGELRMLLPEFAGSQIATSIADSLDEGLIELMSRARLRVRDGINVTLSAAYLLPSEYDAAFAISAVEDCGCAGVSQTLVCQQSGLPSADVRAALTPLLLRGLVELITLPLAHGGGLGYRMVGP